MQNRPGEPGHEPLRILIVAACPFPANHGTPAAIRLLAIELADLGHDVHLVTYPQRDDSLSTGGLKIHRVSLPFASNQEMGIGPSYRRLVYDFLMIFKLVSVIWKYDIQVVHAHNYESTIAAACAKLFTRAPLIYNGVNSMADELASYDFIRPRKLALMFGKFLDYWVPRAGDIVTTLSDELKDYLQSLGIREEKLLVIPPGVELEMFQGGDGERIRALHGLKENPVVMYTGALEAFQRVDYLLLAMRDVVAALPEARLMMVGNIRNTAAAEKYQQMARELGIAEKVVFVESVPLDQLPDYLAAADVAVVPRPNCPGYPIKLLNYMAAGRAIVAFRGSAKALFHGYNGYIAEDHDSAGMAVGITFLLRNEDVRTVLGDRAKGSLSGVFDWATLAKGTELLFREVIKDKRKLNKQAMGKYIRGSYLPRLGSTAKMSGEFLQDGPVVYPTFTDLQGEP